MTTTVDPKGSVPLPEEVLCDSGVRPGDKLDVLAEGEDIILRKVTRPPLEGLLDILRGLRGLPVPKRSRNSVRHVHVQDRHCRRPGEAAR
jgi:bifunctional DNA-binding transcriptional regulator/antitoxin component of YhaV-PrlF toxin-antitoxin module